MLGNVVVGGFVMRPVGVEAAAVKVSINRLCLGKGVFRGLPLELEQRDHNYLMTLHTDPDI